MHGAASFVTGQSALSCVISSLQLCWQQLDIGAHVLPCPGNANTLPSCVTLTVGSAQHMRNSSDFWSAFGTQKWKVAGHSIHLPSTRVLSGALFPLP
jgi:hypothetical protein